jgi:hypothetical protein
MADSSLQYKFEIGMESTYGDGGASFTAIPNANTGRPVPGLKTFQNPSYNGSLGRSKEYVTLSTFSVPINIFLKGSGTAGTTPELTKLLRIMGLQHTNTPATSDAYKVRDTGHESAGIKVNLAGKQYLLTGARMLDGKITLQGGDRATLTGNVVGLNGGVTAVAYSAPSFTDSAIVPAVVTNMALTINGNTHVIKDMTIDLSMTQDEIPSINAANTTGIEEIAIGPRLYGVEFLARIDSNNDLEFWTALSASSEWAVASTGFGSAGNLIDFDFSNMQIMNIVPEEFANQLWYKVTANINYHATAANEFQMAFK